MQYAINVWNVVCFVTPIQNIHALFSLNLFLKYWCMEGKCVYHGHEKPKDGAWGSWGSWSPCSSNCEVGIKERSRRCNKPRYAYI